MLLENDAFLTELTKIFNKAKTDTGVVSQGAPGKPKDSTQEAHQGKPKETKGAKNVRRNTISVTMKRYDGRTKPRPKRNAAGDDAATENFCLIRASMGNKKISTVVHQKDMNKFQLAYANVLKGNIDGLKKKDKKQTVPKSKLKATKAM